jgi:hypothetical protein
MTLWNKVSPASPYLDHVRFSDDEGTVRVGSVGSVGSICTFAFGVSIRRCIGGLLLWRLRPFLPGWSVT